VTFPHSISKPFQKAKKGTLTEGQILWNTKLAEVQVVVENALHAIKVFKILRCVFENWRGRKGQTKGDDVLTICLNLAS
jgi:hypothetical protein